MTKRRQAREIALQSLFQKEFLGKIDIKKSLQFFQNLYPAEPEVWSYAQELLYGVLAEEASINELISSHSSHWNLQRMAFVDVNILRLAVYELSFKKSADPKVIIDEAIEIAKKYGTSDSGAFVNGILDAILKRED